MSVRASTAFEVAALLRTQVAPSVHLEERAVSTTEPDQLEDRSSRLIAESGHDLHVIASADCVYRFVSDAVGPLFGWEPTDVVGRRLAAFAHADDVALVEAAHQRALEQPGTSTAVWRFRCADGTYRWTETFSTAACDQGERFVVSTVRDIGSRKAAEADLQRRATTDPLTGVANRTVFMDRIQQALRRLERRPGMVALLFLDLDRFKLVNDSVGHAMGDALLLQMADRLLRFLRPQDTLARLGGDEFAILVEDITQVDDAVSLGARVIEAGRTPFAFGDETFICTTSVGIAVTTDSGHSAEGLLQEADLALYRAKDRGRDRIELFDEELRTRVVGRLATERMLRRAVDEGRLRVEYQPIIDLRTGATVAAEALVRVWDPGRSRLIEAEAFIAVAEETGLLGDMDDWVLAETIAQAAAWRDGPGDTRCTDVAVNITARHLADATFAGSVIEELAAHGLPSSALQIEVTERVLMEASNSAMTGLKLLRDAGVRVGLDDFGTGYSSLSYLRMFPLDFVKIDRSFVHETRHAGTARAIVSAIVDLSHALGMAVVAEGVETAAQASWLAELGCDRAQGFWFAPSGPARAIEDRVLLPCVSR